MTSRVVIFALAIVLPFQALLTKNLPPPTGTALQYLDEIALLGGLARLAVLPRSELAWLRLRDWTFVLVFLAIGVLSAVVAGGGVMSTALGTFQAGKFAGWLLVMRSIRWEPSDGRRVVVSVASTSALLLALGAIGYFDPELVTKFVLPDNDVLVAEVIGRGASQDTAPFSLPFAQPGVYGWAAAVTALASTALLVELRSRRAILGIIAGLAGALLSLRRKPLAGIAAALAIALGRLTPRQRAWLVSIAVTAAIVIPLVAREQVEVIVEDTVAGYLDADLTDQARFAMLYVSTEVATSRFPLGVGFGRFGGAASVTYYSDVYDETGLSALPGFSPDPDEPHYMLDAYWPHLVGETGWIGAGAMLVFLVQLLRRLRALHRSSSDRELRLVALFAFMLLVEALVESLGSPLFESGLEPVILAMPIGIALRYESVSASPRS